MSKSETLKELDASYRASLRKLLNQCNERQRVFFKRLYPVGIDGMTDQQVRRAIEQCEATIKKNANSSGD